MAHLMESDEMNNKRKDGLPIDGMSMKWPKNANRTAKKEPRKKRQADKESAKRVKTKSISLLTI